MACWHDLSLPHNEFVKWPARCFYLANLKYERDLPGIARGEAGTDRGRANPAPPQGMRQRGGTVQLKSRHLPITRGQRNASAQHHFDFGPQTGPGTL